MPELPEVETIKNGLLPHAKNKSITSSTIRQPKLRWPIPDNLSTLLKNKKIIDIKRRSKYLLFCLKTSDGNTINKNKRDYPDSGVLVIHLGMSGNLQIVDKNTKLKKHDHVDIELNNNKILRYNDPRRFGAILWVDNQNFDDLNKLECLNNHERFAHLGPEPLTDEFNLEYIIKKTRRRNTPAKNFIMNNNIVVGVGNIYATEALFYAKINPFKPVCEIECKQWQTLIAQIKKFLPKP